MEASSQLEGNETPAIAQDVEGREVFGTHQNGAQILEEKPVNSPGTYTEEEYKLKTEQQVENIPKQNISSENQSGTYTEEEYALKNTGKINQTPITNQEIESNQNTYTQEEYGVKNTRETPVETENVPTENQAGTYTGEEYRLKTDKDVVTPEENIKTGETPTIKEAATQGEVKQATGISETQNQTERPETEVNQTEAQTQAQTNTTWEHKVDATGHPIEKFVADGENPYELSNTQMTEINDLYTEKMSKMFPEEKMWNWERIQNYKGMAHSILNLEKVTDEYSPLKKLLQEIHDKTGLKPIENTGLDSGTSPKEYIMKGLQYAQKNNIKIKF